MSPVAIGIQVNWPGEVGTEASQLGGEGGGTDRLTRLCAGAGAGIASGAGVGEGVGPVAGAGAGACAISLSLPCAIRGNLPPL